MSATSSSRTSMPTTPVASATSRTRRSTSSAPRWTRRSTRACARSSATSTGSGRTGRSGSPTTSGATAGSASSRCGQSRASTSRSRSCPLVGHTRGHSAIAVRDGDGWLMHCGDGYFHHGEVQTPPQAPFGVKAFQLMVEIDHKQRVANQGRLRELAAGCGRAGRRGAHVLRARQTRPRPFRRRQRRLTPGPLSPGAGSGPHPAAPGRGREPRPGVSARGPAATPAAAPGGARPCAAPPRRGARPAPRRPPR